MPDKLNYDSDYGPCIGDCENCEYYWEDGCGIDYNGEPRPTALEMIIFILLLVDILLGVIVLDIVGVI